MTTTKTSGTCPCCFGSFVVKGETMVLHGYKRPGHGWIVGHCPATKMFKPYEVSVEGTKYMLKMAQGFLASRQEHLSDLETGKVVELNVTRERASAKQMAFGQRMKLSHSERYETITLRKGDGQKKESWHDVEWFEYVRRDEVDKTKSQIRAVERDIEFYNEKIAAWKPVDLGAKNAEKAQAQAKADAKLCPGSGTTDHDHSRMRYAYYKGGKCNHCGKFVGASSLGNLRKHPAKEG